MKNSSPKNLRFYSHHATKHTPPSSRSPPAPIPYHPHHHRSVYPTPHFTITTPRPNENLINLFTYTVEKRVVHAWSANRFDSASLFILFSLLVFHCDRAEYNRKGMCMVEIWMWFKLFVWMPPYLKQLGLKFISAVSSFSIKWLFFGPSPVSYLMWEVPLAGRPNRVLITRR